MLRRYQHFWTTVYSWQTIKMPATICTLTENHAMSTLMPIITVYSCLCCAHGCVYACNVHLYTLTVTVQLSHWPIRASHPSSRHTHTVDTDQVKCWAWVPRLKRGTKVGMWHEKRYKHGIKHGVNISLILFYGGGAKKSLGYLIGLIAQKTT